MCGQAVTQIPFPRVVQPFYYLYVCTLVTLCMLYVHTYIDMGLQGHVLRKPHERERYGSREVMGQRKRTANGRKEGGEEAGDMTRGQRATEEYRAGVCLRLLHTLCATLAKEREEGVGNT